MKITTPHCPQCGGRCIGTLELVPGVAKLLETEPGTFIYFGGTQLDWDASKTVTDGQGHMLLTCEEAHRWPSAIVQ